MQFTDADIGNSFFKAYLMSLYNVYLDGLDTSAILGFASDLTEDQQNLLYQFAVSMKADSTNYMQTILDDYSDSQMQDLFAVIAKLETDNQFMNLNSEDYEASQALLGNIYDLYSSMYKVNQDVTMTDVFNYMTNNVEKFDDKSYTDDDITTFYADQPKQIAPPDESFPFDFVTPNQQQYVSGREYFNVSTLNNILYRITGDTVYYDQDFFEELYPDLVEQLLLAGLASESEITELTDEGNSYERNVLIFNGDADESLSLYIYVVCTTLT